MSQLKLKKQNNIYILLIMLYIITFFSGVISTIKSYKTNIDKGNRILLMSDVYKCKKIE